MNKIILLVLFAIGSFTLSAQKKEWIADLKQNSQKGDYVILELRLNKEDEFRTKEGSSSSLTRVSLFTGENEGEEILSKKFKGVNSMVKLLNVFSRNGWYLDQIYPIEGESLIITHYILQRKK